MKHAMQRDQTPSTSNVVDLEERTWLPRYVRGEQVCFSKFVEAYRRPIYSYLVRRGLQRASCDDLFQEIFMKVHVAAASYLPQLPQAPWLFTIAVNTVVAETKAPSSIRKVNFCCFDQESMAIYQSLIP